jgi:hypothetical protein
MIGLKTYILESLEEVYHYMGVKDFLNLIATDEFYLSDDDGYNPKGKEEFHFLSTTRQRNALTGYPTGLIDRNIVRITLDYNKLHSKFKSGPVDWGKAKGAAIKKNWDPEDFERMKKSLMLQTNVENEERFYIKGDSINDFFWYVKRVDICKKYCSNKELEGIKFDLRDMYGGIPLKIYDPEKEFNIGK